VWFQQFEYAVGHWFQKAAEHVFGCVLCSPGCFSLFRASALMDDNIMRQYCELAEAPREVVQFDQGKMSQRRPASAKCHMSSRLIHTLNFLNLKFPTLRSDNIVVIALPW